MTIPDQQVERQNAQAKGDDGGERRYSRRSSHHSEDESDG